MFYLELYNLMKIVLEFDSIEAYDDFIQHARRTDPAKAKITRPMPQLTEEQIKIARDWEERSQKLPKPYVGGGYDARKSYEETPVENHYRRFKTEAPTTLPPNMVIATDYNDPSRAAKRSAVLRNAEI